MNAALLLTALFNGAWQGALLCGLALLAFRLFRRLNATTMFTVWSVLLAIAVLLPFLNYAFAPKPYVVHLAPKVQLAQGDMQITTRLGSQRIIFKQQIAANASAPQKLTLNGPVAVEAWLSNAARSIFRYAGIILIAAGVIALFRVTILLRDVVRMLLARGRVRPIEPPVAISGTITRPFGFAASDDFTSPCVLGFAPPLIVIPEELLGQRGSELTSVVLHEREHVRRFDDIQNVIQRFIGAVAFFCPGVRIAIRELALYREQICDDAAVNATGDRISYAMTLTDLAQWAQGRGTPVPSLIFKRKHLLHRLEVLLDSAVNHSMHMNRRFALGAATALVIAAALVLRVQVPVIAETIVAPHAVPKLAQAPHAVPKLVAPKAAVAPRANGAPHIAPVVPKLQHAPAKVAPLKAPRAPHAIPRHAQQTARLSAVTPRTDDKLPYKVAYAYAYRQADATVTQTQTTVSAAFRQSGHDSGGGDLLDALNGAGMSNLSVDQLVALRDHGVTSVLVRAAVSYFGHVSASDLTMLADHGVGVSYIATLRQSGVNGISPANAIKLMDHGVTASLIHSAFAYYNPRPAADDLVTLADHGVTSTFIDSLGRMGVRACTQDTVKMVDSGVDAAYVAKIRRMNPNATISDIIRLRNAGF